MSAKLKQSKSKGRQFVARLSDTVTHFMQDDGLLMSAAVAYYGALSFFPLLLILISGAGLFFEFTQQGADAQKQLLDVIGQSVSTNLRDQVKEIFKSVEENAKLGGPIGIGMLLLTVLVIFVQFERAFDRVWNVPPPPSRGIWGTIKGVLIDRLQAFGMLLALGAIIIAIFVANMVFSTVRAAATERLPLPNWTWMLGQGALSLILNTLVFALLYRFLSKAPVRFREALHGGVFAAVIWEIGRYALAAYIIGGRYSSAYGLVGSFIAVMAWLYYASAVVFLGAEYVQLICDECNAED